jgi:hypothetical protein
MNLGTAAGLAGGAAGIYSGIASGKPTGYAQAGLGAAKLGAQSGAFGQGGGNVQAGAQAGMNVLGLYNGIKQGGVAGYGQAANSAYGLATGTGGIPGVGQALSVYNFAKNYQSGDTGGDALRGAEAGASIGSMIVPGIGTIVGGVIGGAAGALSSAFGNGKVDPENANFNGYTQAYNKAPPAQQAQLAASVQNPYLPLAGYFDLRSNQLKGQNPIYQTYGRRGEQKFTDDLITRVKMGQQFGIKDPSQMWGQIVQPWLNSMGTWNDSNKNALTALMQNMTGQVMSGTYQKNFKAIGGQTVFH